MNKEDVLIELLTEELPPKLLKTYAQSFQDEVSARLIKEELHFEAIRYYATPRRLSLWIKQLDVESPSQVSERKGPTLKAAYDATGKPTNALMGFLKSADKTIADVITLKSEQGEWVGLRQTRSGNTTVSILPMILKECVSHLPIKKGMRWGSHRDVFIRPVHGLTLLYGKAVVPLTLFGCESGRTTKGHRFKHPQLIEIAEAKRYESQLKDQGYVMVDFEKRREFIRNLAETLVKTQFGSDAIVSIDADLLDEVTGLVEWPTAYCGSFANHFLQLPKEVLISSMQDHQRYFPVLNKQQQLLPHFIMISNIESKDPKRLVHGNERVLRARLADAQFFYETDKRETLEKRLERLKGMIDQAKLGTLYDKSQRLEKIADFIAQKLAVDVKLSRRAAKLAKTDLTTLMVNEFPELQGIMGSYYALLEGEDKAIAAAIKEHYLPRFAKDDLPQTRIGQVIAVADKIDTLVGAFGINHIPTGEKDPYGLRRTGVAILRILIQNQLHIDLRELIEFSQQQFLHPLENKTLTNDLLLFLQERLKANYLEEGIPADVFAAVSALNLSDPFDMHKRISAVLAFKQLKSSESLSIANKRVSNILTKYPEKLTAKEINPQYFEDQFEKELARVVEEKKQYIHDLHAARDYNGVLLQLTELSKPIDDFF